MASRVKCRQSGMGGRVSWLHGWRWKGMFSPFHWEPRGHMFLTTALLRWHLCTAHLAKPLWGILYHLVPRGDLGDQQLKVRSTAANLHIAERSWEVAEASRIKDGIYETTGMWSVSTLAGSVICFCNLVTSSPTVPVDAVQIQLTLRKKRWRPNPGGTLSGVDYILAKMEKQFPGKPHRKSCTNHKGVPVYVLISFFFKNIF